MLFWNSVWFSVRCASKWQHACIVCSLLCYVLCVYVWTLLPSFRLHTEFRLCLPMQYSAGENEDALISIQFVCNRPIVICVILLRRYSRYCRGRMILWQETKQISGFVCIHVKQKKNKQNLLHPYLNFKLFKWQMFLWILTTTKRKNVSSFSFVPDFFVFNFSQEMNPFVFWHKIRIIRFENHIDGKIHNSRYVEKNDLTIRLT